MCNNQMYILIQNIDKILENTSSLNTSAKLPVDVNFVLPS